jgi:hypothetical protein
MLLLHNGDLVLRERACGRGCPWVSVSESGARALPEYLRQLARSLNASCDFSQVRQRQPSALRYDGAPGRFGRLPALPLYDEVSRAN